MQFIATLQSRQSTNLPDTGRNRMTLPTPTFRNALPSDTHRCHEIESSAYEGDEAATEEKSATRIRQYPQGFLVLELAGRLAGFINSGCAHNVVMSDERFKELVGHDPDAPNVVVMSVVIDPAFQGRGLASLLMRTFVDRMVAQGKKTIHLMCKERHIGFYRRLGFAYVNASDSSHGGMSWHEMVMTL
jgi:ribosomal protein S18 acetylase RimI-like enzyme